MDNKPGPAEESSSPAELATIVVDEFVAEQADAPEPRVRLDLQHRVETALRTAMRTEREACARICHRRAALWSSTEARADAPASLKAEARMRYVEASYLADAIQAR